MVESRQWVSPSFAHTKPTSSRVSSNSSMMFNASSHHHHHQEISSLGKSFFNQLPAKQILPIYFINDVPVVAVLKRSQEGFALSKERLLLNLGGKKSHNCLCQLGPGAGDVNLRDSQYSAAKRLSHREGKLDQLLY